MKKRGHRKTGSVHLGGKNFVNKIKTTYKPALSEFKIWIGGILH